jgi:hypothetical protein
MVKGERGKVNGEWGKGKGERGKVNGEGTKGKGRKERWREVEGAKNSEEPRILECDEEGASGPDISPLYPHAGRGD